MKTFVIDEENNITVFAENWETRINDVTFQSEKELQARAVAWPTHRLVDIWNSLTGVTPVKKFTDRKTAITRIWKAIQRLQPAEADEKASHSRHVGTGRAAKGKGARKAKAKKAAADGANEGQEAREGGKKAAILELLRKPKGGHAQRSDGRYELAGAQRARVHQRSHRQEDGPPGRIHQTR